MNFLSGRNMDSHRSEPRSSITHLSPPKLGFHSRKSSSLPSGDSFQLRSQLDLARKKISDLETDVQRLLSDDAKSRRKLVEERAKHEEIVTELKKKLKRKRKRLPEELETEVGENLASVNSLHKVVMEEINTMKVSAEKRVKEKEFNLQVTYTSRVQELERELATQRNLFEPDSTPLDPQSDPSLEAKIVQFEEFNTRLQEANRSLRSKMKEAQSMNDAYSKQYAAILRENAKLKQLLKEKTEQTAQIGSVFSQTIEELPSITVKPTKTLLSDVELLQNQLSTAKTDLKSLKKQLFFERSRRTELLSVFEQCISDVRNESVSMAAYSGRYRGELTEKERELVVKYLLERKEAMEILKKEAFRLGEDKKIGRSASVVTLGEGKHKK